MQKNLLDLHTYQDWKTRTKFAERDDTYNDGDDSDDGKKGGYKGMKNRSKGQTANGGGGKFKVAGMHNRRCKS